ncbi:hypothetical protein ABT391_31035 [Streptomyces jumonjinensis]|uniref:hypothetical protein n=1 Tax=Streptomyces jumonjinensis TaxID=1945 RepID=UPI003326A905
MGRNRKAALGWDQQAAAMPPGVFTRSVGMRLAIVGTAHLQARDLDHGLEFGNRSVDILARVQSTRTKDHVREFNAPWPPGGVSQPFANSSTAPAKRPVPPPDLGIGGGLSGGDLVAVGGVVEGDRVECC